MSGRAKGSASSTPALNKLDPGFESTTWFQSLIVKRIGQCFQLEPLLVLSLRHYSEDGRGGGGGVGRPRGAGSVCRAAPAVKRCKLTPA